MVSTIGSSFVTASANNTQKTQDSFLKTSQDYLNLFMAQIKYQDPAEPFSVSEMSQSLANLSTVQQSIETNLKLEQLITMSSNSQASSATSLINKQVEYLGNDFYYDGVNNQKVTYNIDQGYENILLEVKDSEGKVVQKVSGKQNLGEQFYSWDGKDSEGKKLEAGKYTITVNALDENEQYQSLDIITKGIVTGVDFTNNGEPTLVLGTPSAPVKVSLGNVANIFELADTNQPANDNTN